MPPDPAAPPSPSPSPYPPAPAGPPTADPPATGATPPPDPTADLGDAGKKALAEERKARSDAEKAAKAANAELEKYRKAAMTDQEKAVAEAEERGKVTATKAGGERLAAAEIKAALTGVVPDPAAIVEDLALSRYVTDDGDVDAKKVAALAAKYAGFAATKATVPGVPAGARSGVEQLSRDALKSMTPDQIVAARTAGQLDDLMSGKVG